MAATFTLLGHQIPPILPCYQPLMSFKFKFVYILIFWFLFFFKEYFLFFVPILISYVYFTSLFSISFPNSSINIFLSLGREQTKA